MTGKTLILDKSMRIQPPPMPDAPLSKAGAMGGGKTIEGAAGRVGPAPARASAMPPAGPGQTFHQRVAQPDLAGAIGTSLRAVRVNLLSVMLFTCVTNMLVLAIPLYLFQISDRVLTSRSTDTLVMLTIVIVGAVVLQVIFDAIRRFILMRTSIDVSARLGAPILAAAARASLQSNGREY